MSRRVERAIAAVIAGLLALVLAREVSGAALRGETAATSLQVAVLNALHEDVLGQVTAASALTCPHGKQRNGCWAQDTWNQPWLKARVVLGGFRVLSRDQG